MNKKNHLAQAQKIKEQLIYNSEQKMSKFDLADKYLLQDETGSKQNSEEIAKINANPIIRNSLAIPKNDYELIDRIIKRCMKKAVSASRMEVIRAAINFLYSQDDHTITTLINALPPAGKQGKRKLI